MSTVDKSLREKIDSDVAHIDWDALADHAQRGALILVDTKLDLTTVALAVAEDRADVVGVWIDDGAIRKIAPDEVEAYDSVPGTVFRFAIVQPFVLAQIKPS